MNIIVITPPPAEPVTIEEAFVHLRLDDASSPEDNPDYAAVASQIVSAREQCEQITRRAFVQQTLRLVHGSMPPGRGWVGWSRYRQSLELLRPPLVSVSAVRYFDAANVLQRVDPASYFVTDDLVPLLRFVDAFDMPCTYGREDAVQVEYVAGYPAVPAQGGGAPDYRANVPASIKQAILLSVQLQYDELTPERQASIERARDALLSSYRIAKF